MKPTKPYYSGQRIRDYSDGYRRTVCILKETHREQKTRLL